MNKKVSILIIAGMLSLGFIGKADATKKPGNGNDGCQIGNIPGHKDHGQSNEHKINYMTKTEWEAYLIANNITAKQMSNNEGSNGWITYHIYNAEGKQIEVVHIRFKQEEIPPVTEPEVPEEKPETPETPEIPEEKPPVENTDVPMTPIEPSVPVEKPENSTPMVPLEPSKPIETPEIPEDSIPMLPLEPSIPTEKPEDDNKTDIDDSEITETPDKEESEDIEEPFQPDPGPMGEMGKSEHDPDNDEYMPFHPDSPTTDKEWEIVDDPELEEAIRKEHEEDKKEETVDYENPQTGDASLALSVTSLIGASLGLVSIRRKK